MHGVSSSVYCDKQTPPLGAITLLHSILQQLSTQSQILVENSRFLPHCHTVWYEKVEWVAIWKTCLLVSTEYTNLTDTLTDGRTPHDCIGRVYAWHRAALITFVDDM